MVALDPEAHWLVSARLRHVRSSGDPGELDEAIDLGLRLVRTNSLGLDVAFELYLTARASARSADALLVMEAIVDGYRRAERRPWGKDLSGVLVSLALDTRGGEAGDWRRARWR